VITVELHAGPYAPSVDAFRVGHRFGSVILTLGDKLLEMGTVIAHRTGFQLVKKAHEAKHVNACVRLRVESSDFLLLPNEATQLGGALLRKADDADDFQRQARA
jgi:hypothetical protein